MIYHNGEYLILGGAGGGVKFRDMGLVNRMETHLTATRGHEQSLSYAHATRC